MRRLVGGSFALALLAGISAGGTPSPAPPPSAASPGSTASPAPHRPRVHFFVGEVVEIIAPENRFSVRETLRDGSPKVTFFRVSPQTTVSRGKDRATFADLRANDHVTIRYAEAPTPEKPALAIRITPSKTAAAPAKPPA